MQKAAVVYNALHRKDDASCCFEIFLNCFPLDVYVSV